MKHNIQHSHSLHLSALGPEEDWSIHVGEGSSRGPLEGARKQGLGSGGGWLHGGVEGWLMGERAGRPLPGSQVKGNEGRFRERQD